MSFMTIKQPDQSTPTRPESLSDLLRPVFKGLVDRIASSMIRIGVSPNGLTIIGALLGVCAALLAAQGAYASAGILCLLAGPFDALDGAVARMSGKMTRFGSLLDSTLDRYSEAFVLIGIGYSLARAGRWDGLVLAFLSMLGSLMVSYTRARSEGLAVENKGGWLTRFERVAILSVALLTGLIVPGLLLLAIFSHVTVGQRLWHGYRLTRPDKPDSASTAVNRR
jgi:CDP-diacylglycerol--glycerol-3-phosphate 3-phosphatidyltransferase